MNLELILQTSALLAVAALMTRLLNRAAPSTRHLVWQLAIVSAMLALTDSDSQVREKSVARLVLLGLPK